MADIQKFLADLKEKGLSAPDGVHWDRLCKLILQRSKVNDGERLLNPLILGGSIASHAVKHERLAHHLEWAARHQCLQEALGYLIRLSEEHWNKSDGTDWNKEDPWAIGDEFTDGS